MSRGDRDLAVPARPPGQNWDDATMMALIDSNATRAGGTRDLRRSRKTRRIDWINNF